MRYTFDGDCIANRIHEDKFLGKHGYTVVHGVAIHVPSDTCSKKYIDRVRRGLSPRELELKPNFCGISVGMNPLFVTLTNVVFVPIHQLWSNYHRYGIYWLLLVISCASHECHENHTIVLPLAKTGSFVMYFCLYLIWYPLMYV